MHPGTSAEMPLNHPRGIRRPIWDLGSDVTGSRLAVILLLPSLLVLLVLVGGAMLGAGLLSVSDLVVAGGSVSLVFVGLRNFAAFLNDPRLHQTILQTLLFTSCRVSGVILIGIALAMLLNRSARGVGLLKRLFLLPWALSFVVNGLIWGWLFSGNFGLVNASLSALGLIAEYRSWLSDPQTAMGVIILGDVWKATPFVALMFLAGLQGLPRDIEDAAEVDGAGPMAKFRYITIPWLKPVLLVVLVLETTWSLKTFDIIWVLTQGGPLDTTMVLNVYAYQQTFQFMKFGYGASIGVLILALNLLLALAYFRTLRSFEA